MKTIGKSALFAVLLVFAITMIAHAEQYPKSTGYVNDFANLLTREQGASLNNELVAFEKATAIEIAVVTVPQLNNQSIEDYTRGLAKEWGVGKRNQNNGIIFLVAPKERKMRIETASGARAILTNVRADQIRDQVVLPRFKANNMAQGIIAGTSAIMRTFDASSEPVTSERNTSQESPLSTSQSVPREWKEDDTRKFSYALVIIIGMMSLLLLIGSLIRRSSARQDVLEGKSTIATLLAMADELAKNSDVKEETRKKLANLKSEFSKIDCLTAASKGTKWIEVRENLNSINYPLRQIVSEMKLEIDFAEKARKEGPELLKKIPGIIKVARKRLAKGKQSPKAVKYLEEAQAQYAQVQNQQSGMTMIDWVVLYAILTNIQSNTANAESAHQYVNTDNNNSSSSVSSDSSPSQGFGDNISFGGGGGFDSGDGGSSGSF